MSVNSRSSLLAFGTDSSHVEMPFTCQWWMAVYGMNLLLCRLKDNRCWKEWCELFTYAWKFRTLYLTWGKLLWVCAYFSIKCMFLFLSLFQILPPILASCDLYLKIMAGILCWRIPCKSYGSRYISLKTDFCPHLGSRIKVLKNFALLAGSSSHASNLASSPGCDSVMLCAYCLLASLQEDSFHHHEAERGTG